MIKCLPPVLIFLAASCCWANNPAAQDRVEAEYYVAAYARHYRVPVNFVRSIVEQESGWRSCAVSSKGAVGLMQIMPGTALRLGIGNRCNIKENVSGGVRYLAWLIRKFRGDMRLAAAAYYAGEDVIAKRGLNYHNPDVVAYVAHVQAAYARQTADVSKLQSISRRTKSR
jgi:soluble lytic murein transglycosylase-like protein